jgi:peptide/nickel transport system permease protein
MRSMLVLRGLAAGITIVGVATIVFALLHLAPGDPVDVMLGESARPAERLQLRAALGLDRPLFVQWLDYLGGLARMDLGMSLHGRVPVATLLATRFPATLALALAALGIALGLALPLGVTAAVRHRRAFDRAALAFAALGAAIPSFWLGPLLILVFAIGLEWLPVSEIGTARGLVLPALTLGIGMAALLSRMVRATLLEVLAEDYVRTARAKGLPEPAVIAHALRTAALPLLTVVGLQFGALLSGAVITETLFGWPGIGSLLVEAIQRRDYPLVQGCVALIAICYVLVNSATDLVCRLADPRLRDVA